MLNRLGKGKFTISNVPLLIIAAEIMYIIYMNIVRCNAYPELDMAKLYRHAIEMANNHSFFISGWNYITTMELDCSLILAVPIYMIIKNIYLAFGIANLIFLAVYVYILWDILAKINTKPVYKYFVIIVFLIPYRVGMLEYFNMMFFNGGQYVVKVLIPLILIDLIMETSDKQWRIKNIILTAILFLLMVVTSMSSGTYVLMSGVLPVIVAYIMNVVINGDIKGFKLSKIIVSFISLAGFVIGYLLCRVLEVSPNSEAMDLISPNYLVDNILTTFWGYLSVFLPEKYPGVISRDGIIQLLRYGMAFLVIILILWNITKLFKKTYEADSLRLLMMPFIFTALILNLTKCCFSDVYYPERYFFIGLVPLFITIPYILEAIEGASPSKLAYQTVCFVLAGFTTLLLLANVYDARREVAYGYEGGYSSVYAVVDYAKSENVNNIFWLYNLPDGEVARMLAPELKSTVINFYDDGRAFLDTARDFYYAANENKYYEGENILVEKNGSGDFDRMPDYIKNYYNKTAEVGGYIIYKAKENRFDNMAGCPSYGMTSSVDYCYTEGYSINGNITEDGYLNMTGDGNYGLLGPEISSEDYNVLLTVNYRIPEANQAESIGTINLLNDKYETVDSADITGMSASFTLEKGRKYHLCINPNMGESVEIGDIEYEACL